jgi:hypothetical protein
LVDSFEFELLYIFKRSFHPSTGVQDCTLSTNCMSYRLADCLLAGTRWKLFHFVPASMQSTKMYDIYLMLYAQSWTPDDGRKDRPKHVEWYSINSKNCASSWFYYRNIIHADLLLAPVINVFNPFRQRKKNCFSLWPIKDFNSLFTAYVTCFDKKILFVRRVYIHFLLSDTHDEQRQIPHTFKNTLAPGKGSPYVKIQQTSSLQNQSGLTVHTSGDVPDSVTYKRFITFNVRS